VVGELQHSKSWLESVSGQEVDEVAYPDGSYSRAVVDAAERIGFRYHLAVEYLHPEDSQDRRLRDRIGLYSDRGWIEQLHRLNQYAMIGLTRLVT
jgi:peptidoglycan/xylan/chitin deacetylase (PgdA/CDA1 family)